MVYKTILPLIWCFNRSPYSDRRA